MKKNIICLACLVASASLTAQAQTAAADALYTLTSGKAVMTIDAQRGARVTSLTLGDKQLIAQHKKAEGTMPNGRPRFENMHDYGSTFWPSPQSVWSWPPIATYDSRPYKCAVIDITGSKTKPTSLTFTSDTDARHPYIFSKTFEAKGGGQFAITYTMQNVADTAVTVAPWEITRVPSGGVIVFDTPDVRPANTVPTEQSDNLMWLPFVPDSQNRKIFADATGWLAFANDGLLFIKEFDNITTATAAPEEDEVEIYFNAGSTYTEIENQGAYTRIEPHKSLSWTVTWHLDKAPRSLSHAALKKAIMKKINK